MVSNDRFFSLSRSNARFSHKQFFRIHCFALTQQNGVVRMSEDGFEPRSQFMNCLRCHGLMVTIRLEDAGSSSPCYFGWQCLLCGAVSHFAFSGVLSCSQNCQNCS